MVAFSPIFALFALNKSIVLKELNMVRVLVWSVFIGLGYTPNASADVSAFVSRVGFDETTDLENALGAGIRWGKSSRIIGGETSLM